MKQSPVDRQDSIDINIIGSNSRCMGVRLKYIEYFALALGLNLSAASSFALINVNGSLEADANCRGNYSCHPETIAADTRSPKLIVQPSNHQTVKGHCSTLPRSLDFQAQPTRLTCGTGTEHRLRERIAHTQEDIDKNYELLQYSDPDSRASAQKVLLKDYGWIHQIKFNVIENWIYKKKVGDYIDCRDKYGSEGGEVERYQTTCYRRNRQERVLQPYRRMVRNCIRANDPPPTIDSGGGSSGGGYDSSPRFRIDSSPDGAGEDRGSGGDRFDRGFNSSIDSKRSKERNRVPAFTLRRLQEIVTHENGSEPTYGCAFWGSYHTDATWEEEKWVPAEDLQYPCVKERNRWCTWYVNERASQLCPEMKTARIEVRYQTPSDWNPSNSNYDDQLPNKFDLLMGEGEILTVKANKHQSSDIMEPSVQIVNALKGRDHPWNQYDVRFSPTQATCGYHDQSFDLEVEAIRRIEQSAPNTLMVPTDEQGTESALQGLDSKDRPAKLVLINPTRTQVLDRSNLSRIIGEDANDSGSRQEHSQIKTDPALAKAGISKKFWENTRFWMRLVWMDGDRKVKVSLGRPFDINKANPLAEELDISLTGENGMPRFYKLAVPFENIFGFLGGDVSLDPKKDYFIEIKVAQPNFDGIYTSGLKDDPTLSDEEKRLTNDDAYSESKFIPLGKVESKRSLLQKLWDWRARHFWRP